MRLLPEDSKLVFIFILWIVQYTQELVHKVRNRWCNVGPGLIPKKNKRACVKPKGKKAADIEAVEVHVKSDKAGSLMKKTRNWWNTTTMTKVNILLYMYLFLVQPLPSAMSPTNQSKCLLQKLLLNISSCPIPRMIIIPSSVLSPKLSCFFLLKLSLILILQPWPIEDDGNDGQLPVNYEHDIDELMQG